MDNVTHLAYISSHVNNILCHFVKIPQKRHTFESCNTICAFWERKEVERLNLIHATFDW